MVRRRGATTLGCLFTLLIISALVYFGAGATEIYWRYLEFKDAMTTEARFRSKQPDSQIIARLKYVADSLGLPEDAGKVIIRRRGGEITIESHYEEYIELPGFAKEWHFEPRAVGGF